MMFYEVQALGDVVPGDTESPPEAIRHGGYSPTIANTIPHEAETRPMTKSVGEPLHAVRSRISRHGEVVDVVGAQAGNLETRADRFGREACTVFDARESLFFERDHELTVREQASGHIPVKGINPQDVHVLIRESLRASGATKGSRPLTE